MNKITGLAALTFAAIHMHGMARTAAPAASSAEILDLQGKGEQRLSVETPWSLAKTMQVLPAGAYVRTGTSSRMALLFSDQTQIRLHENSTLQIKAIASPSQPVTSLAIKVGRAWMQTKRTPDSRLILESPAATAAIRGTDWEFDVDSSGKTMLTVLSGTVELTNSQGSVTVGKNEAAIAEPGKAPVKIQLNNPRDRIQWVNALTADPLRHVRKVDMPAALVPVRLALARGEVRDAQALLAQSADRQWSAVLTSAIHMLSGEPAEARRILKNLIDAHPHGLSSASYLLLSDIELVSGNGAAAIAILENGLQALPGHPDLLAHLARAQLLSDRVTESEQTLAKAGGHANINILLAQGQLARRKGDAPATLGAYAQAVKTAPEDDRSWYGLGSAQTEREDVGPARRHILKALEINPRGPGYLSELGMLDTFTNHFVDAEKSLSEALAQNPGDYLALTGQGLLHLKQGQPVEALDAFLRAGAMEPRYARAKTYTAVAYYQIGRHQDAISTLLQASELDDKDPVPYMFLSQIYTDLFRAGEAVQASREAVKRLPYLKSLNQLANDQKGSANLGASLSFFGLEDWALELAQQSYYPYWAGSHLFLADRYAGEFNKNSKLFQGFLADPLVFGASNRYASLLQRSGSYGAADIAYEKDFYRIATPSVTLNGLNNAVVPISYFVQRQRAIGHGFPIDVGTSGVPAYFDTTGRAGVRATVSTLGMGIQPVDGLGLFAYHNDFDVALNGRNAVDPFIAPVAGTSIGNKARNSALGMSYRWSPVSQTWFKLGAAFDKTTFANMPVVFAETSVFGVLSLSGAPTKKINDAQLRHTIDLSPATRASIGLEHVRESQSSQVTALGAVLVTDPADPFFSMIDLLGMQGANEIRRRFTALTLSAQHEVSKQLSLDGALTFNHTRERINGADDVVLFGSNVLQSTSLQKNDAATKFNPRVGIVVRPRDDLVMRAAYQDWIRPLSAGSLNDVETAGIPVEDRLAEAGGRLKRGVAQLGWTPNPRTFITFRTDYTRINNPGALGVDLRTPSLPFLEQLRNAQTLNLSTVDLLEETPSFERGVMRHFSIGLNRILADDLSGYIKLIHQDTTSAYADANAPSGKVSGMRIPYIPRNTFLFGATWSSQRRIYASGRLVYRTKRFEDMENLTVLPSGWSMDLIGMWESPDKQWALSGAAMNLLGKKSDRQTEQYAINVRYRF